MSDDRISRLSDADWSDGRGADPGRSPLAHDEVFALLSSPRRRRVVRYLLLNDGEVSSGTLVDAIAALEAAPGSDSPETGDRKSVYVSLRQTHLPRLAEAGVVEYDPEEDTVRPTARLSLLAPPLRAVDELSPHESDGEPTLPESAGELASHDAPDPADDAADDD